jgi:hypothetical protein
MFEIKPMASGDEAALECMLLADPGNLIYASPNFLDFLKSVTGASIHVLLASTDSAVTGALPYAVYSLEGYGTVVNSLPWWGSHGSVVLDRQSPRAQETRTALLNAFRLRMDEMRPLSFTIILLPDEESFRDVYETILLPDAVDERIGQITPLPDSGNNLEERIFSVFSQKTRNLVRKSLKQGLKELVTDEDWAWDFLFETHRANMEAIGGRAKPHSHFQALRKTLSPSERRLSLAMDGETPTAALLTLSFNRTVEYFTPVIKQGFRSRQPLSFLIYCGMIAAINSGYANWNWGGTWPTQSSLHHFKAGFGAVDRPYSYLVRSSAEGREIFRQHKDNLQELAPNFYAYPQYKLI